MVILHLGASGGPWVPKSSDSAPPLKPIACLYDRIDKVVFVMFDVLECSCFCQHVLISFFLSIFYVVFGSEYSVVLISRNVCTWSYDRGAGARGGPWT